MSLDGLNNHMFEDKKARYDAMNSLASNFFQMHELEKQKVHETGDPVHNQDMEKQSAELADKYFQEGMKFSNEMSKFMFDFQAQITRSFIFLLQGQLG